MKLRAELAILALNLTLAGCGTCDPGRPDLEIGGQGAVLPVSAVPELLDQCSRDTVSPVDSYWMPSQDDIDELERRLPGFLAATSGRTPSRPLSEYHRQYGGVVSADRNLIYVSFLHRSTFRIPGDFPDWRTEAVVMCDGGDSYWGISFDVRSREFTSPQFNGEA